ncbi:MAG: response regulator [Acidimicrobiales bacterium]
MVTANVLVVDDDRDVRASVADILRDAGYRVEEAADGDEALEVLDREEIGALVLDLRMPRCGGVALLNKLDHPPPVVVVSARDVDTHEKRQIDGKVSAFLAKPVAPARLIEHVRRALQGGNSEQRQTTS